MKYYATKLCIYKLIVFLVLSFFWVTAHARQQCQDIIIYSSGACPGGVAMCTEGRERTQKVCYEVPDGAGPIQGGPNSGVGGNVGGGGSAPPPPPPKPDCDALNKDILDKYLACRPSIDEYKRQLNSCPPDKDITRTIGVGGSGYTAGYTQVVTYNPGKSCKDSLAIGYNAGLKDCEDTKDAKAAFLPAVCKK